MQVPRYLIGLHVAKPSYIKNLNAMRQRIAIIMSRFLGNSGTIYLFIFDIGLTLLRHGADYGKNNTNCHKLKKLGAGECPPLSKITIPFFGKAAAAGEAFNYCRQSVSIINKQIALVRALFHGHKAIDRLGIRIV